MSNYRKTLIVIPILIFILACQAVTRPIDQVKDTAGPRPRTQRRRENSSRKPPTWPRKPRRSPR